MEAHHLVPLSAQELFNTSGLDSIANIVCLCPNCHKNLHYGKDIKFMLEKIYNERKQALEKSGIIITFDELLELYN
jgi:5-methylcytosine-specific restriction protein A